MKSNFEIIKQWKKQKKITKDGLSPQYRNTEECQAFYAGDFADFWIGAQAVDSFGVKKRAMVQVNKVKPYVNAVKGFMAQNRRQIKYSARVFGEMKQTMFSEYANGLASFIRTKAYADQKETRQDGDLLIGGYGAIETDLTYTNGRASSDRNGQVSMMRLDPLAVGWDPYAKETNILDSRWVFHEQIYDLADALSLLQDSTSEDFEGVTEDDLLDGEQGYKFYSRGGRYNKIKESSLDWSDQKNEKVKVYFYQWYEYESFYRCHNPLNDLPPSPAVAFVMQQLELLAQENNEQQDDAFRFDPHDPIWTFDKPVKERIEKLFDGIEILEQKRKVFFTAVVSKDHVFTKFRNICQQGYTIKFKTGDYDAKNKIWVGMVNSMREPVLYYNKALTELMFIIGSNSKGGVLVEEDAVDDIAKFEQQYAKTDATIVVNAGAISGNKIKAKKEPYSLTGYENIVQMTGSDIHDVTGIDKSFLGSSENKQETGLLQSRRIRQVVSSLACYFDSITLYQFEQAYLLIDLMRVYAQNNDGGIFSILGKDGGMNFLQIEAEKIISEYDLMINEAPQSPDDKKEYATTLLAIADKLMAIDPATAKMVLAIASKYLDIESADQQQIMQALMPKQGNVNPAQLQALEQQLQQMQSRIMQVELAEKMSKINVNNAKAALDQAKLPEVAATVQQKEADAFHKVHEAVLDEYVARRDPHPQLEA